METLVERATRLGIETATVGEMLDEIEQLREKVDYLVDGMRNVFPAAHRLALELECLLLDTKDTVAVSKWWDSGNEALEQWREFCREDEKLGVKLDADMQDKLSLADEIEKLKKWHMEIVLLSAGWGEDGSTGPKDPLSWETVGRMAMDYARAALRPSV